MQKSLDIVVQRCRSRLAPIHMLPPKLLVLVFRYCAADQATPLHYLDGLWDPHMSVEGAELYPAAVQPV